MKQQSGCYAHVHYLFNGLIYNLSDQSLRINLFNTWKNLYELSNKSNIRSTLKNKAIHFEIKNPKYLFILTLTILLIILLNFVLCIILTRHGHNCRKREYNCLNNGQMQLNIEKAQQHGGSSPSSTNSNGTITQQLVVNTNYTTQTNDLSNISTVNVLHSKKNTRLRSSSQNKTSLLSEANVL